MPNIVGIKFNNSGKIYFFGPKDIEFKVLDYTNFAPDSITNALIYCDPPYNGTK